jgi:hypothetical protein
VSGSALSLKGGFATSPRASKSFIAKTDHCRTRETNMLHCRLPVNQHAARFGDSQDVVTQCLPAYPSPTPLTAVQFTVDSYGIISAEMYSPLH